MMHKRYPDPRTYAGSVAAIPSPSGTVRVPSNLASRVCAFWKKKGFKQIAYHDNQTMIYQGDTGMHNPHTKSQPPNAHSAASCALGAFQALPDCIPARQGG